MARILVLIDDSYPYGTGEPFLETETKYYYGFDRVIIVPSFCGEFKLTRVIYSENIEVIRPNSAFFKNKLYARVFALFIQILNIEFWKEIINLTKKKKINIKRVMHLLSFLTKGDQIYKHIDRWINNNCNNNDKFLFYSYWMYYQSYACVKLSKRYNPSKCVTRCHGFDLYEYRNDSAYIPMREYIFKGVDVVHSISSDGKKYLINKYKSLNMHINISHLGTEDYGIKTTNLLEIPFTIVSCSSIVPVKRVERIITVLSTIIDINIHWIHFGDGDTFKDVYKQARANLKNNITFDFKGRVSNNEVLEFYKNNKCHLFVNVSESEGIPVSIMEAASFGIPIIATDVGGTNEIVVSGYNGYLLNKDFKIEDLSNLIKKVAEMNEKSYEQLRVNSRKHWQDNFCAKNNYVSFTDSLVSLL